MFVEFGRKLCEEQKKMSTTKLMDRAIQLERRNDFNEEYSEIIQQLSNLDDLEIDNLLARRSMV